MRMCKFCSTRFGDEKALCPSCGRRAFSNVVDSGVPDAGVRPLSEPSEALMSEVEPESEATVEPEVVAEAAEVDAEPEMLAEPEPVEASAPAPKQKSKAKSASKRKSGRKSASKRKRAKKAEPEESEIELVEQDVLAAAIEPEAPEEEKPEAPVGRLVDPEPGPAVLHLSAAQVRTLVAEQPELLEPGLRIHRDDRDSPVGVDFGSPVGAIDLLARDRDGSFVVVAVPDPRDTELLMPGMLARIGYVRKHIADEHEAVRGLVVVDEIPASLGWAAAGASQTIRFKTYRVALSFHDLTL